jgi:hypothetical protein
MDEGVKRPGASATFALNERAALNKEIDDVLRQGGHAQAADLLEAGRATMARHGGVARLLEDMSGGANPLTTEGKLDMAALQGRLRELVQSGELPPQFIPMLQAMAHRGGPMSVADQPGRLWTPFISGGPTGPRIGTNLAEMSKSRLPSFAGQGITPRVDALVGRPSAVPADAALTALGQMILRRAYQQEP